MSFQHPASGSSKKRQHSSAESGEKGLGGLDPGDLDIGLPPAPAYRLRSQGQEPNAAGKTLLWSTL